MAVRLAVKRSYLDLSVLNVLNAIIRKLPISPASDTNHSRRVGLMTCIQSGIRGRRRSLGAPRTDPSMRFQRTRLPPWVFDAKALGRPGVSDPGSGQEAVCQPVHIGPGRAIPLAAPAQ